MYQSRISRSGPPASPPEQLRLVGRERQVAGIVYALSSATAREVEAQLNPAITNAAVRSMLVRLVQKKVLTRSGVICAKGGVEYVYLPRARQTEFEFTALKRLSEDFFDGSLHKTARFLSEMI